MENQLTVSLKPVPRATHLKFPDIEAVPASNWYGYTLVCTHTVYSRVRIRVPRDHSFMEHYIRCAVAKHTPLEWQGITEMEAVSDEFVRDVSSGNSFVLPSRVLRVDGHYAVRIEGLAADDPERDVIRAHNSGNPYPYVSRDRDY